jgi:hypothetical protein
MFNSAFYPKGHVSGIAAGKNAIVSSLTGSLTALAPTNRVISFLNVHPKACNPDGWNN